MNKDELIEKYSDLAESQRIMGHGYKESIDSLDKIITEYRSPSLVAESYKARLVKVKGLFKSTADLQAAFNVFVDDLKHIEL